MPDLKHTPEPVTLNMKGRVCRWVDTLVDIRDARGVLHVAVKPSKDKKSWNVEVTLFSDGMDKEVTRKYSLRRLIEEFKQCYLQK